MASCAHLPTGGHSAALHMRPFRRTGSPCLGHQPCSRRWLGTPQRATSRGFAGVARRPTAHGDVCLRFDVRGLPQHATRLAGDRVEIRASQITMSWSASLWHGDDGGLVGWRRRRAGPAEMQPPCAPTRPHVPRSGGRSTPPRRHLRIICPCVGGMPMVPRRASSGRQRRPRLPLSPPVPTRRCKDKQPWLRPDDQVNMTWGLRVGRIAPAPYVQGKCDTCTPDFATDSAEWGARPGQVWQSLMSGSDSFCVFSSFPFPLLLHLAPILGLASTC